MEHNNSKIVLFLLLVVGVIFPVSVFAATSPSLGGMSTYGIISSTYTNSLNAGLETTINGDVCYTTGPATAPIAINGATVTPCAIVRGTEQSSALVDLNGQACTSLGANVVLSGTYTPGCYSSTGTMNIVLNTTVTLNGTGTFIFRSGGAFTTGANSVVALAGGANASDVFWVPGGAMTIGANSSTSASPTFVGNIIANALGSTGITLGHFVNLLGRALAFGHTVTTDSNTINLPIPSPAHLIVIKHVINDNAGVSVASLFTTTISGVTTATATAAGAESPGVDNTLTSVGAYSVDEGAHVGYNKALSAGCSGTIALGETKTCTITNDDINPVLPATITVIKVVVGGSKVISDFPLFVSGAPVTSGVTNTFAAPASYTISETTDPNYTQSFSGSCVAGNVSLIAGSIEVCTITNTYINPGLPSPSGGLRFNSDPLVPPLIDVVKVPSPLALPNGPGPVNYTYTLRNIGTVPVSNITMVGDSCSPITLTSGDINNDSILAVNETWVYNCSTNLSVTHTNTVVATGWANGISAVDVASATVIVGVPIVPPLIHVTKIPNPLALFSSGGPVVYTETVTNPGTVPLSNVVLTDDKCMPVKYISGDSNGNSRLDPTETWKYTCQTKIYKTTTNTAIATGEGNGISVKDFAIATVIVSVVPKLPQTGFPPEKHNLNLYEFIENFIQTLTNFN